MNRCRALSSLVLLSLFTLSAHAQPQFPQPSPEHAMLKKLAGTWDANLKMKGQTGDNPAVVKYEMLGDFWVLGTYEGSVQGMKFTGKSFDGFDPRKKKFVGTWLDSLSPTAIHLEGTYDAATKTQTSTGDSVGMDGNPVKVKTVLTWKDDDTLQFVMHEGKDANSVQEMFTIEYKRRK